MRRFTKINLLLTIVCISNLLSACDKNDGMSRLMIVEKQRAEVVFADTSKCCYKPQFYVDVPISGPKVLVDSVMFFLNEQLYQSCEEMLAIYGEEKHRLAFDDVKTNNSDNLLKTYVEKYRAYFEKELENFFTVSMSMIAQTESFVTYGVEFYHCGGSCGSELKCYTFNKSDGHRIGEIISKEQLLKFLNDHPDYKKVVEENRPPVDDNIAYDIRDVTLMQDSLLYVINGVVNHYSIMKVGYEDVMLYLSDEAKKLVKMQSDGEPFSWEDWYVGYQIGVVCTDDADTIYLMERYPQILYDYDFSPSSELKDDVLLTVCKKEGRNYVLVDLLLKDGKTGSSITFNLPNFAWSNPNLDNGYFAFDEDKRELYAPYWADSLTVKMLVYQFNGHQFLYNGESVDSYSKIK